MNISSQEVHYLIDAYNLIFTAPIRGSCIEERRNKLIHYIEQFFRDRHHEATLVFDGQVDPYLFNCMHLRKLKIVYSYEKSTADDEIIARVDQEVQTKNTIVVSSDRELLQKARNRGCKTQTIREFTHFLIAKEEKSDEEEVRISDKETEKLFKIFERWQEDI